MRPAPVPPPSPPLLRTAIVLGGDEEACTILDERGERVVHFAPRFPRPRAGRVSPGHLVAIALGDDGAEAVVWRWFDAVVVGTTGAGLTLWEPGHGIVSAQPRDPRRAPVAGSRAYLSAGLPGAEWWVAGPTVELAASADVELEEVRAFVDSHGSSDDVT